MTITLNHTLIGAADHTAAARLFATIMGARFAGHAGPGGKFAQVQVNDTLTLDFATADPVHPQHLAFDVDGATFNQIRSRLRNAGVPFGNSPHDFANGRVDHPLAARGLYWPHPDGHLFEVMTDTAEDA
jgi:catechol 2,3-dioxygenase-like lactoylglutathione lyase family enzyme